MQLGLGRIEKQAFGYPRVVTMSGRGDAQEGAGVMSVEDHLFTNWSGPDYDASG
jgi:hypothetical protein